MGIVFHICKSHAFLWKGKWILILLMHLSLLQYIVLIEICEENLAAYKRVARKGRIWWMPNMKSSFSFVEKKWFEFAKEFYLILESFIFSIFGKYTKRVFEELTNDSHSITFFLRHTLFWFVLERVGKIEVLSISIQLW